MRIIGNEQDEERCAPGCQRQDRVCWGDWRRWDEVPLQMKDLCQAPFS